MLGFPHRRGSRAAALFVVGCIGTGAVAGCATSAGPGPAERAELQGAYADRKFVQSPRGEFWAEVAGTAPLTPEEEGAYREETQAEQEKVAQCMAARASNTCPGRRSSTSPWSTRARRPRTSRRN